MRLVVWEPELNLTKGAQARSKASPFQLFLSSGQVIFDRSKVAEVLSFQEKKYEAFCRVPPKLSHVAERISACGWKLPNAQARLKLSSPHSQIKLLESGEQKTAEPDKIEPRPDRETQSFFCEAGQPAPGNQFL